MADKPGHFLQGFLQKSRLSVEILRLLKFKIKLVPAKKMTYKDVRVYEDVCFNDRVTDVSTTVRLQMKMNIRWTGCVQFEACGRDVSIL